ncbi:unnamed protein product [Didymodactylos carnosus]|uniref:Uncharacterized protein n=1 Tax=Didymodactylos carnosus TaxID=1234261 RepID=A0A8S2ZV25_9BILA|nr:unnamed protein product [Didymodactylos carnosus]
MVVVGIDVEDANSGLSGNDVTDVTMAGDVDVALTGDSTCWDGEELSAKCGCGILNINVGMFCWAVVMIGMPVGI